MQLYVTVGLRAYYSISFDPDLDRILQEIAIKIYITLIYSVWNCNQLFAFLHALYIYVTKVIVISFGTLTINAS